MASNFGNHTPRPDRFPVPDLAFEVLQVQDGSNRVGPEASEGTAP